MKKILIGLALIFGAVGADSLMAQGGPPPHPRPDYAYEHREGRPGERRAHERGYEERRGDRPYDRGYDERRGDRPHDRGYDERRGPRDRYGRHHEHFDRRRDRHEFRECRKHRHCDRDHHDRGRHRGHRD